MNRRGFLSVLAAGLAAAVDPERAIWVPGRKLISIPKPQPLVQIYFNVGDIFTIDGKYAINPKTRREMEFLQKYRVTLESYGP